MTREKAIKIIKEFINGTCLHLVDQEALETLIPELAESEDERIIRAIIDALYSHTNSINLLSSRGYQMGDIEAWLENQKKTSINWMKSDNVKNPDKPYIDKAGRFYTTDGRMCYASEIEKQKDQKDYNKLYEDISKSEWFKKAYAGKSLGGDDEQKEQNPVESSDDELQKHQDELYDFKVFATKQAKEQHISFVHDFEWNNFCAELLSYFNEQKPAEWSEEDEKKLERVDDLLWMLDDYISDDCSICEERTARLRDEIHNELFPWLEFLRPQSKDEIYKEKDEAFKLGKHQLAIKFMNYLDENRPEGKMSLSNGECEDIDKAFKENDWAKIMRYVEKYSSQPKQEWSEEDEEMLDIVLTMVDCSTVVPHSGGQLHPSDNYKKDISNWLKSFRPQYHGDVTMTEAYKMGFEAGKTSSWKPSEEQMKALEDTMAYIPEFFKPKSNLASLLRDLKKQV